METPTVVEPANMAHGGLMNSTAMAYLDDNDADMAEFAAANAPAFVGDHSGEYDNDMETIHAAFLHVYKFRGKSTPIDADFETLLARTNFMSRYAGFLYNAQDIPNLVRLNGGDVIDKAEFHIREIIGVNNCRTKLLLGVILYKGICDVFMHLVNSSPSGASAHQVRKVVGWAFSAMDVASRCLLIMTGPNYTPTGKDTDRLYGRGEIFGCLLSLSRCLSLCNMLDRASTSIRSYIVDMCRYINAFGTALLRVLIKHEDSLRSMLMASFDAPQNSDLDRVRMATQYALLKCVQQINKLASRGTKQSIPIESVCNYRVMMDILFKYETLTRNKLLDEGIFDNSYLNQDTKMMLAQCKSLYDINSILDKLAADCRSTDYDIMSGLMPGHCDTNFPTIKSEMPCSTVVADGGGTSMVGAAAYVNNNENLMHKIVDPATSTTLYMHNMMILDSQDTIPVHTSNHNYFKLKAMNAQFGKISALPLIVHGLNGETKSREERYFYQHNAHMKDMQNFYVKACSVSSSNVSLYMRCVNFEMMDSDTFSTMVEAMKSCDGLPRPADVALAMYHNKQCMRMAMNTFYQHYMSETADPTMHCWDNNFFGSFHNWLISNTFTVGTISYKSAQLLLSGALMFGSNMPRIADSSGNPAAGGGDPVSRTRIRMDKHSAGTIVDQTVRDMIEDGSEVNILSKSLLEVDFLRPYKGRFQGNYLTHCRFIDSTTFRLFLSKCYYNMYGDEIRFMVPTAEIEFLLRLLKPTTRLEMSETSKKNANTVNAIISKAAKASVEAGRYFARR